MYGYNVCSNSPPWTLWCIWQGISFWSNIQSLVPDWETGNIGVAIVGGKGKARYIGVAIVGGGGEGYQPPDIVNMWGDMVVWLQGRYS